MSSDNPDAIVIGSGISGLTVAALLARKGRKVVIVEQNRKPGGALRRFTRGGIPFDIGFHYTGGLGRDQILEVLWKYLGVWPEVVPVPMHPEGYDFFKFRESETEVKAYYSYAGARDQLCSVFPHESAGIDKYLATIKNICREIPFYNLDLPLSPFLRNFFSTKDQPLAEAVSAMVRDPELQAVLAAPAFLYGVPPSKAGLTMHAAVAHSYYQGAWGIRGGGQAVVDAFLKILGGQGVEVLTGCKVERIEVGDGRVSGVSLADRTIRAGQVIYTGHPAHLPGLVAPGSFRPAFCHRVKELEDTVSMFIVFGRMARPAALPGLDRANLYSIDKGLDLMDNPAAAGKKGAVLLTAPGRRDLVKTGEADPGAEGVILMRPADWMETKRFDRDPGKRGAGYREWKRGAAENLIASAAESFGTACLDIEPLAAGTPLTFRDELGSPAGGIYGVQHNLHQFVARARTKVQGLYLSGQGSLMTGLLGASMAGLVTAGEIMGIEDTWDRVRKCH